jgi:hypothetical protein
MAEEQVPEPSRGDPADGQWVTVAEAARQLGISPRAIRGRIKRGTIEWKPVGNTGRLVLVQPGDTSPDDPGDKVEDELDRLREELLEARVGQARAEERALALRELADELKAQLGEARRPWWRRLLG